MIRLIPPFSKTIRCLIPGLNAGFPSCAYFANGREEGIGSGLQSFYASPLSSDAEVVFVDFPARRVRFDFWLSSGLMSL